jgi:hypothetical protein
MNGVYISARSVVGVVCSLQAQQMHSQLMAIVFANEGTAWSDNFIKPDLMLLGYRIAADCVSSQSGVQVPGLGLEVNWSLLPDGLS